MYYDCEMDCDCDMDFCCNPSSEYENSRDNKWSRCRDYFNKETPHPVDSTITPNIPLDGVTDPPPVQGLISNPIGSFLKPIDETPQLLQGGVVPEPVTETLGGPLGELPFVVGLTLNPTFVENTKYEEESESWFSKPNAPTPPPTPDSCIPYEPPLYQKDTRVVRDLEIPFDYLWGLEVAFPYNFYPRLFFTQFTANAVNADTKPANVVFWAYRPGQAWNPRWDAITVTGPTTPPNPDPTHYTDAHWNYIYRTKWRYTTDTPNYGIERYTTPPYAPDTQQSYVNSLPKVPMTGFLNGAVSSIAELTSKYNSTIHYKLQFTLDETKENAYMYYFKESRYLPSSIQTATSAGAINPLFASWSATDLSDFKTWALNNADVTNPYFSGPALAGTCPVNPGEPGGPPPTPVVGNQYTSDFSITGLPTASEMMNTITSDSNSFPHIFSQDPDGLSHILPWMWQDGQWDGNPIDPTIMTNEELCEWLKPVQTETHFVIRGVRDLFYQTRPFVDDENPTPREIDLWNIEVIRHFRRMFGITTPANLDARLSLEARWASERKYTEAWDISYPLDCDGLNTKGGPCGPCWNPPGTPVDTAAGHCGAAFFPSIADRTPYINAPPFFNNTTIYPELDNYTLREGKGEGVSAITVELPWSLKFAVILANFICNEGLGGHAGPYVGPGTTRDKFGFDWWRSGANVAFRGKYS